MKRPLIGRGRAPRPMTACPPDALHVPAEDVLLLAVDLPLASPRKRLEALPFAIEDRIAMPLETVHIALGDEIAPRRYLVAVASHARMAEWLARLGEEGRPHAAMVPDVLALPLPAPGEWAIDVRGSRALVRLGNGTGVALPAAALASAWMAAGRPAFVLLGEPGPASLAPAGGRLSGAAAPMLDLRQGRYAGRLPRLSAPWRRAAMVVGAGLCAHLAILLADTLALRGIAEARRNETRGLVAAAAPGRWGGDDIMTVAMDLLPHTGADQPGRFLPLLARASSSLAPLAPEVTLRALRFDASAGMLALDLEATEPALIDRAARSLGTEATGAIMQGGHARATVTLHDGPVS